MARVRLVDVARAAGVHPGTASRALNPAARDGVSKQTVRRVEQAATTLGYVANSMARGLRTSRSMVVTLVVPDITNPLFPPIVRGAENVLSGAGYTLVLTDTNHDPVTERDQVLAMRGRGVDGFIIATAHLESATLASLAEDEVPTVLVNRRTRSASLPFVGADDRHGVKLCVDHLVELGHRRIVHLAGPPTTSTAEDRADAFQASVLTHQLEAETFEADSFTEESGAAVVRKRLEAGARFTAIVAANDLLAIGALQALGEHGISCPDQVSITGYNDIDYVSKLTPPLTTVHVPLRREGELAAETLLRVIKGQTDSAMQMLLPVELMRRGTTGPAPR
jgi:LacI family transcriptional regulator